MTEDLLEIKADVKEIRRSVTSIEVVLAKNTESLITHEKRTSLSEDRIKSLEYWLLGMLASALAALLGYLLFK